MEDKNIKNVNVEFKCVAIEIDMYKNCSEKKTVSHGF
jgi:hypothetical protein